MTQKTVREFKQYIIRLSDEHLEKLSKEHIAYCQSKGITTCDLSFNKFLHAVITNYSVNKS